MPEPLAWIDEELQSLKKTGLYNTIRTLDSPQGAWLVVDGKKVLNFCSNNYLGLANHPHILCKRLPKPCRIMALDRVLCAALPAFMSLHIRLEERLAAFKKVPAAITFQSGFSANLAAIPALVGKRDVIFSDELNHASIIDGSRLSGAKIIRFALRPADLGRKSRRRHSTYRRGIVISDGVFSMDGDIAPLDKLVEIAKKV